MSKKKKKKAHFHQELVLAKKQSNFLFLWFCLGIWVFALFYNQWGTMERLSNAVNPIARFGTITQFFNFLNQYGYKIFIGFDKFIIYLILLIPIFLIFLEIKSKYISRWIDYLPKSTYYILLYLFIISFVSLRSYFALGTDLYTGDASYFMLLTKLITQNLKHFILFPYWTFMYGGGAPFNQFYGPLHSYIAGFINLLTGNIYFATKLTLFVFHLSSVFGVFLFIKQITQSKKAAFISGLATILLYHHIHVILFPGRYGIASIWAIYPFVFYFFEKFIYDKKLISGLGLSLAIAFMIFSSIGMSLYFFLFWGVYGFFRLLFLDIEIKEKLILSIQLIFFSILGLFLSSYYIYSFLQEGQWSSYGKAFGKYKIGGIGKNIFKQIFLWNNYQISLFKFDYAWQSSYFGISLLFISLTSIILIVKEKKNQFYHFIISLIFLLIYMVGYGRWKFLLKIPYLHTYSQVRSFNIFAFWIIFLTGIGYFLLGKNSKRPKKLFVFILFFIIIDLFPTTFHDTWGKKYGDYGLPFFNYLKQNFGNKKNIPDFTTDILGKQGSRAVHDNWRAYDAFIPETGCPLLAESGNDYIKIIEFFRFVHNNVYQQNPQITMNALLNFYSLFNTRFIFTSIPLPQQYFKHYQKNGSIFFLELKQHTPILLTTKLTNVTYSSNLFLPFLNSLAITTNKKINKMWVIDGPTTNLNTQISSFSLIQYTITAKETFFKLKISNKAFAVLSASAYPTVKVFLNGKKIKPYETLYGHIVIPLVAGENKIIIRPSRSFLSALFFYSATVLMFIVLVYIILYLFLRKKKRLHQ